MQKKKLKMFNHNRKGWVPWISFACTTALEQEKALQLALMLNRFKCVPFCIYTCTRHSAKCISAPPPHYDLLQSSHITPHYQTLMTGSNGLWIVYHSHSDGK